MLGVGSVVGADDYQAEGLGELALPVDAEQLGARLEIGEVGGEVAVVVGLLARGLVQAHGRLDLVDLIGILADVLSELLVVGGQAVVVHAGGEMDGPAVDQRDRSVERSAVDARVTGPAPVRGAVADVVIHDIDRSAGRNKHVGCGANR